MEGSRMKDDGAPTLRWYSTGELAAVTDYSVQQVRDLEDLHVIPSAHRQTNGYRQFTGVHLTALRAYRRLAFAMGPALARSTMRQLYALSYNEAIATVGALHANLAHSRDETITALHALDQILDESLDDAPADPTDAMTITELSSALGVRSSTLRYWEHEGLITPERESQRAPRRYPPGAVRDARIITALRAGNYGIPAVRAVMTSLDTLGTTADARDSLRRRLQDIAARSDALLRAGTDLADLLQPQASHHSPDEKGRKV